MPIVQTVAQIILEGLKLFSEHQKTALQKEHYDALKHLEDAQNAKFPSYTDLELALAKMRLEKFYKAYHLELQNVTKAHENKLGLNL